MTARRVSYRATVAVAAVAVLVSPNTSLATATAPGPHMTAAPVAAVIRQNSTQSDQISATLQVLSRLHDFGYSIDTPARADRAIRHWQRVNGLTVDGVVGPQTLASLGMSVHDAATATRPVVRDNLPPGATVEDVIRFVWPDQLENRAVQIATRESRLVPTARNACCFGLFQINWSAHRGWLAGIGVTDPSQLLDAGTNARAALALFDRDGWRPWDL